MKLSLDKLKQICPDIDAVKVITEPRGYDGWLVHLCYETGKCADFRVDYPDIGAHEFDMWKVTQKAIVAQLEHHQANKTVNHVP